MYFVYIIQSELTRDLYFGYTNDLDRRIQQHNDGENASTKFGIPWQIIYCEGYRSEKDARVREKKLKHYGNARTYIKSRIKNSEL